MGAACAAPWVPAYAGKLWIHSLDEIQPLRRCIEAEFGTVPCFKCPANIVRLPLTSPDERQAPDHRPHLVMKEASSSGTDVDFVADPFDSQAVERLHRTFRLAMHRPERREVVSADEHCGTFRHCIGFKLGGNMPNPSTVERRRRPAIQNAIKILASDT